MQQQWREKQDPGKLCWGQLNLERQSSQRNTWSLKETAWEKLLQEVANGKAGNVSGADGTV